MPMKPHKGELTHGWEVKMHHEHPNADGLLLDPANPNKARCPICGCYRERFLLIDVSSLPSQLTLGKNWACDGCWTRWERERVKLPDGREFTEHVMYELMGAPAALIQDVKDAHEKREHRRGKPPV